MFWVGTKVRKKAGYRFTGVVVATFVKRDLVTVRLVVECTAPDCEGMLHIFSMDDLERDE